MLTLIHTLRLAYLEHINVLCSYRSITDYPRERERVGLGAPLLLID
jgi:hypothetical protein